MLGDFNIPSVDHLREGIDYRVVDWDFATQAPAASGAAEGQRPTSGQGCQEGFKPVFGVCRKVKEGGGEKDWDTSQKSDQEKQLEGEAQKAGSDVKSNKAFESGGKKFGWAIKGGKPVIVAWGSVAGEKKVGAKQTPATGSPAAGAPAAAPTTPAAQPNR